MQQTGLFFLISISLFLGIWSVGYNIPKLLIVLIYLAYIIFCIKAFKNIKIRFLAYPFIISNLFFGWFFYEAAGLSSSNAVGLGYVMIFAFMFLILPIMLIALAIGAVLDIMEFINKSKEKGAD